MKRNKKWAGELVSGMQSDIVAHHEARLPAVDIAEVIKTKPHVVLKPAHDDITYDFDDVIWGVDPKTLKVGDSVILQRTPSDDPVVTQILDGNNPDPTAHPEGKELKSRVDSISSQARFWKAPVENTTELAATLTDADGTVRLSLGSNALYRYTATTSTWDIISGGGGGGGSTTFAALTDVSLTSLTTGDLLKWNGSAWVNGTPAAIGLLTASVATSTYAPLLTQQTTTVSLALASSTAPGLERVVLTRASVTVTMPLTHVAGQIVTVKDAAGTAAASNVTIAGNGSTMDGSSSIVIRNNWFSYRFLSDGTNWFVV